MPGSGAREGAALRIPGHAGQQRLVDRHGARHSAARRARLARRARALARLHRGLEPIRSRLYRYPLGLPGRPRAFSRRAGRDRRIARGARQRPVPGSLEPAEDLPARARRARCRRGAWPLA